jgi:hypothetical protein
MQLERALESLQAAELCLEAQLVNSAVSRAYYAMFQAAQVALEAAGVARAQWSHPALQAAFTTELSIAARRFRQCSGTISLWASACDRPPTMGGRVSVAGSRSAWCDGQLSLSRPSKREPDVDPQVRLDDRRALLDAKLTELVLFAKQLCPSAAVEGSAIQYEDEDGRVEMFPPPVLSEAEEDRVEMALAARAAEIFADTRLYIVCAVLDPAAR